MFKLVMQIHCIIDQQNAACFESNLRMSRQWTITFCRNFTNLTSYMQMIVMKYWPPETSINAPMHLLMGFLIRIWRLKIYLENISIEMVMLLLQNLFFFG